MKKALRAAKRFYREHALLIDVLLLALIVRLVYLNAVASMVFDENFYVAAARSILSTGIDPNIEHPPLVKFVLAASIRVFGDNPLAWRVFPVIFGLAAAASLYFIALELLRDKKAAALAAALLAFDSLNMVMSRLAMLDIFMLGFALAGAYFALRRRFAWAGLLFGLGIASKWPAALGLFAVLSFLYLKRKINLERAALTLVVAAVTYVLVCSPIIVQEGPTKWANDQAYNIGKSASIPSANDQSSVAWEWLTLRKPVWLTWNKPDFAPPADMLWLVNLLGGAPALAIVAFGNPVFWIPGLLALAWLAIGKLRKLSDVRLFALLWFAFTYVPFLLISRTHMFLYYMLPVLPAYALALSALLIRKKWEGWYLMLLAASVILFLPLVIGLPAPGYYYSLLSPVIGAHP